MKLKANLVRLALVLLGLTPGVAPDALAVGQLTSRSLTLSTSQAAVAVDYTFSFKAGTTSNVGAIEFQVCDSPVEGVSCANSGSSSGASFLTNGASLQSQSGISGFTTGTGTPPAPTANTFWITNGTPQNVNAGSTVTVTLHNVHNPTASNAEFYGRVTTFSQSNGTSEVDYGGIAVGTASQINVTGYMPESLIFCVGTSITGNCSSVSGTSVDLGTFTPSGTNTGTSLMDVSTNAGSGYAITINGATMTSGANTISAMGTQSANSAGCAPSCTSTTGASQFGTNVRANTTPAVGADVNPTGAGFNGVGFGGYNTINSFRFFTGDEVASSATVSGAQLFTNSYIVNVSGSQAAGQYTSTLTYICTATF